MSDLVGNRENRFSHNDAQFNQNDSFETSAGYRSIPDPFKTLFNPDEFNKLYNVLNSAFSLRYWAIVLSSNADTLETKKAHTKTAK